MTDKSHEDNWLKSSEIRKKLKVSACKLAHLRDAGQLPYRKKGNAYLYEDDEDAFRKIREQL